MCRPYSARSAGVSGVPLSCSHGPALHFIGQVGTALFVAPEVMQNFNGGRYDGQAADVWACGVVAFIMLCGRHPYLRCVLRGASEVM